MIDSHAFILYLSRLVSLKFVLANYKLIELKHRILSEASKERGGAHAPIIFSKNSVFLSLISYIHILLLVNLHGVHPVKN